MLQKQQIGQGPVRASHSCLEQTDSSGNQQMTTAATRDANFKNSSRYQGSLYDQARKHVIKAHSSIQEQSESAPQTCSSRAINQYKKEEQRGRQSKIKPASARGISCAEQKMEQSMDEVSTRRHKRNKTLTSYNQSEDITEKQSKLFGQIENLKTELHTLIFDGEEEISSQFAQEFFKNSNRYEQEKRIEAQRTQELGDYSFMGSQDAKELMTEEEVKVQEDGRFEKALAKFFNQPDLQSFQSLLDFASQEGNDVLAFKDTNGKVWEIVEHISDDQGEEEEDESQEGDHTESIEEEEKQESPIKFGMDDEVDPDDYKLSTSGYAERQQSKDEIEAKKVSLSILSLGEDNEAGGREGEQKWRQFY